MQKNKKTEFIGTTLPLISLGTLAALELLSFINEKLNAIISIDKLILLTAGLLPFVFTLGFVVSIISLFKSQTKKAAFIGVVLNGVLLILLLYLSKSFLKELELLS